MTSSMKQLKLVLAGKEPYINLNYKGRKAVINLSLKQLADITRTDKDIDEYPHIFDKDMFLEYPKQLKARVLLERDYTELVSKAEQYQSMKQELEDKDKNTTALVSKITKRQDKIQQLQDELESKDEIIAELMERNTELDKEVTKLKTSIDYVIQDKKSTVEYISNDRQTLILELDKTKQQLEAIKMKSLAETINIEREYERLLYELQGYNKFVVPFKIDSWINKFLDKLHLQELQRSEHESIDGETDE